MRNPRIEGSYASHYLGKVSRKIKETGLAAVLGFGLGGSASGQECNSSAEDLSLDAQGKSYCMEFFIPEEPIVGSQSELTLRAYHEDGINELWIVEDNDFLNKRVKNCGGDPECSFNVEMNQDFEGGRYLVGSLWKNPRNFVGEINKSLYFNCGEDYCPPDPVYIDFFNWMREFGYEECITSKYIEFSEDVGKGAVMKQFLNSRPLFGSQPIELNFYDIIPSDEESTYNLMEGGEGFNCVNDSSWPDFCPNPRSADFRFVEDHFERTFGVEFNFNYIGIDLDYTDTFGEPILEGGRYRFPNSRFEFLQQFPENSIVHYGLETFNGRGYVDFTGGSFVAEVDFEPNSVLLASIWPHEWGHTLKWPHPWVGVKRPVNLLENLISLDGVMDSTYYNNGNGDFLDPKERYAFAESYNDADRFAQDYFNGVIGTALLPDCFGIDPANVSLKVRNEDSNNISLELIVENKGNIKTGYIPLSVFVGEDLLEERIIRHLSAGGSDIQNFNFAKNNIRDRDVSFYLDRDNNINELDETNNFSSFRYSVPDNEFIRGDANSDEIIDIGDPVKMLEVAFLGGKLDCYDAADANDSGDLDLSDAIYMLEYSFLGGPAPPPPFGSVNNLMHGTDPTEDSLTCGIVEPCLPRELVVDQCNDSGDVDYLEACGNSGSLYQSFTTDNNSIGSVSLRLRALGGRSDEPAISTVRLRRGSLEGDVIATERHIVDSNLRELKWFQYDFCPPAKVTPGETVVIEWHREEPQQLPANILNWVSNGNNPYPNGQAYGCTGIPKPDDDRDFKTFTF